MYDHEMNSKLSASIASNGIAPPPPPPPSSPVLVEQLQELGRLNVRLEGLHAVLKEVADRLLGSIPEGTGTASAYSQQHGGVAGEFERMLHDAHDRVGWLRNVADRLEQLA